MTSTLFSVAGSAAQVAQVVAHGSTTALAIVNTAGVDTVEWSVVGKSHAATTVTITPVGKGHTATITFPVDPGYDQAILLEAKGNGGRGPTGTHDANLICRRVIGTMTHSSIVPLCCNEEFERDETVGWVKGLNEYIRALDSAVEETLSAIVTFSAAEDGSDDWVRLNALVESEYGPGGRRRKILMLNGTYRMVQHTQWPRVGVHIEAQGPGVSIVCDVPNPDTDLNYRGPFCYDNGVVTPQPVATLSAQYARNVDTISVASTIAPQVWQVLGLVAVDGATLTEYFGIVSVTGAGPYTLKLSRALKYTHTVVNTTLTFFNAVRDVKLIGNGASISGAADRFFSFPMSRDIEIKGWVLDGSQCVEYMCSIDGGSERGHISEMVLHNVVSIGCCLEYGFGNRISDCYADGAGALFGTWGDSDVLENLVGVGNNGLGTAGLILGPCAYPTKGSSENLTVRNVTLTNCASGMSAANVKNLIAEGIKTSGGTQGIYTSGTVDYPMKATFSRYTSEGSSDGAYVAVAYCDLVFEDCDLSVGTGGAGYVGRSLASTCTATHVRGSVTLGTVGQVGISMAGGNLYLEKTLFDSTLGPAYSQPVVVAGNLWANGLRFKTHANTYYCIVGGANTVLRVDDCRIISGSPSTGVRVDVATSYAWIGENNDFSAATIIAYGGLGRFNFGTAALNGATPVSLPFAPTKAGSRVRLDRKTVGGTPSPALTWGVAAGVGGTMVSAAGDTSTVAWKIYES